MNDKLNKSFWSRVWHHAGFHSWDEMRSDIKREDVGPIAFVLFVTAIIIGVTVYFSL